MTSSLPLAGLTIVVTRPREQAEPLTRRIQALGGCCIQFPLLEIVPLADEKPLRTVLSRLHEFQLAIFISPNAVRYGMEAISKAGVALDSLQIATVGPGSATALHKHGIDKVISPQQGFDSESLLSLPELQNVKGMHVLIFRGDSGRELLGDTLTLRGANVEYVTCYHRIKPEGDIHTLLAAKPDALCVSSSESLRNLWSLLNSGNRCALITTPLFVSHPRIAEAAHKLGWYPIISTTGGDEGLLSDLLTWAATRRGT